MQPGEHAEIKQEVLLAAAVLAAYKKAKESQKPAKIEDIARSLFDLKQAGINLGELSLKRIPGGFYSEDVEMLIGHYLDAKFATKRSPVQLSEAGWSLLSSIIADQKRQNPNSLERVEQILGALA
jgi:hypothetical protein